MTQATQKVLRALLEDPQAEMYGLEICEKAELPTGTIHPILARFEAIGWLEQRWEDVDPSVVGRPRRRYYRLTRDGAIEAKQALARIWKSSSRSSARPAAAS